ncbi:hypothetical protein Taro_051502, partial [Colocasia esculenta]|nr:hypothetical protein [Colocasia esculenta]
MAPGAVTMEVVCVIFLDTLTPMFELYIRRRERRQWAATRVCGCAVACSALMVGGVVLVGLYYSLALLRGCGAAVGPLVRDCETEMWFLYCVVRVIVVLWWYLVVVGHAYDRAHERPGMLKVDNLALTTLYPYTLTDLEENDHRIAK